MQNMNVCHPMRKTLPIIIAMLCLVAFNSAGQEVGIPIYYDEIKPYERGVEFSQPVNTYDWSAVYVEGHGTGEHQYYDYFDLGFKFDSKCERGVVLDELRVYYRVYTSKSDVSKKIFDFCPVYFAYGMGRYIKENPIKELAFNSNRFDTGETGSHTCGWIEKSNNILKSDHAAGLYIIKVMATYRINTGFSDDKNGLPQLETEEWQEFLPGYPRVVPITKGEDYNQWKRNYR